MSIIRMAICIKATKAVRTENTNSILWWIPRCNDSLNRGACFCLRQVENPTISDGLWEEDPPTFPKRTFKTKSKRQWHQKKKKKKKREKPTPVPLLFSFNSVNRPQVKISCSCQFNSASNDAATRSLFLFFALFLCLFIAPPHTPLPSPSHHPLSSISLSVSRIELSCSSNRQHRESLVHLGSLTDGYFTPIIWVLCVCLRRCVYVCMGAASQMCAHAHTHTHKSPPATDITPTTPPARHCIVRLLLLTECQSWGEMS